MRRMCVDTHFAGRFAVCLSDTCAGHKYTMVMRVMVEASTLKNALGLKLNLHR